MDNGFKQPLPPFLTDPATIIADLDAAGVDVACASIAPPLSHLDCDPQIALGVSRAINDAYAELADEYEGRILPLGNVPLQDVDLALQELKRIVTDYGFKGVQVGSNIDGRTWATSRCSRSGSRCVRWTCSSSPTGCHPWARSACPSTS